MIQVFVLENQKLSEKMKWKLVCSSGALDASSYRIELKSLIELFKSTEV